MVLKQILNISIHALRTQEEELIKTKFMAYKFYFLQNRVSKKIKETSVSIAHTEKYFQRVKPLLGESEWLQTVTYGSS